MKSLIKNIAILIAVLILAYLSAGFAGQWYEKLFPGPTSIFLGDFTSLIGFPLTYSLILSLLFAAFGGAKKYWWLGILLVPAVIFEVYFDLEHIYFPIILGLAGLLLGFLVSKFLPKSSY
mgnify:CR=1 FL=1